MALSGEALGRFFALHKSRFGKCLDPTMQCPSAAIRAHSTQNAGVMDLLAEDGHVVTPRQFVSNDGPDIELARVGRNQASTFTGLCNVHDTQLFIPIDSRPFDPADPKQLFLIAYRSVTRELHAVMEGGIKAQSGYQDRVARGVDSATDPSPAGVWATQQLIKSYETYMYRAENFDKIIFSEDYSSIEHDVFVLNDQEPVIAVSALFSLDHVAVGNDVARAILNIFPTGETTTVVILSYTKEDAPCARRALDRILSADGPYQKYELSKLIINRIENFIISPRHFATWSDDKKKMIKDEFVRTLPGGEVIDHADLMLF